MSTKTGHNLTLSDVYPSTHGWAENDPTRMFAADVCGSSSIPTAIEALVQGERVSYACCTREDDLAVAVKEVHSFQVPEFGGGGLRCVRYCGEQGKSMGAGSGTLWGSIHDTGKPEDIDRVQLAADLTYVLCLAGKWFFRLVDEKVASDGEEN